MQMGMSVSAILLALLGTKVRKYLAPVRDLLVDAGVWGLKILEYEALSKYLAPAPDLLVDADQVVYERLCCL